jgi:hypothetical protein
LERGGGFPHLYAGIPRYNNRSLANTAEVESDGVEVKEPVTAYLPCPEYVKVLDGMLRKGSHGVLCFIKGVGPSLAQKIIDYRRQERFLINYGDQLKVTKLWQ